MVGEPPRRRFIAHAMALACGWAAPAPGRAQAPDRFDLILRGGTVIDPARGMQARADLGIRAGRIASIEPELAPALAARVIDASRRWIAPGLIDLHTRVFAGRGPSRAPVDALAGSSGVTTWVSAGDVSVDELAVFRDFSARHSRCRVYAFARFDRRVAARGAAADALLARELARQRSALGLALRLSAAQDGDGMDTLARAITILQQTQTRGRILCHVDDGASVDELLDRLRPGDILTHPFRGAGNPLVQDGKFRPALLAARNKGVVLDVGYGTQFDAGVARAALEQGLLPDVLSSDLRLGAAGPVQPRLADVMSVFLHLGLAPEQVLAMTTVNPGRVVGREPHLGTLALGAPADIAVLGLVDGPARIGGVDVDRRIEPVLTLRSGVPLPA
jgi:dihydroorotase